MIAYRRDFDENKCMFCFIKDDELLEKYSKIWEKVKNNLKFDSEPVYNEQFLKIKKNPIMEKLTQISTTIKYQKKVLNVFPYQQF